jgi:hypothetical protein
LYFTPLQIFKRKTLVILSIGCIGQAKQDFMEIKNNFGRDKEQNWVSCKNGFSYTRLWDIKTQGRKFRRKVSHSFIQ